MDRPKHFLPMNLQFFADPNPEVDDTLVVDDDDDIDGTPNPDDLPDDTQDPDPDPDLDVKTPPEPTDETDWVKKRLARAERSYERKFLEEAASQSEGVALERQDLPKAVKLWNILKHNPDVSRAVDDVLRKAGEDGKLKSLMEIRPDARINKMAANFDLKEAELELRYSDSVFKKHEEAIKDWAESEGLDVNNPKTLKLALKAWKQDNAALILAERLKSKPAAPADDTRKSAKLVGGKSSPKAQAIDYRKASDSDILKHLGVSLFSED